MNIKKLSKVNDSRDNLDTPIADVKLAAKVLGLTLEEAKSWAEGPNYKNYNESHMKKGEKAAKKYLGESVFNSLDPTSSDSLLAVLDKARGKGKKVKDSSTQTIEWGDVSTEGTIEIVGEVVPEGYKILRINVLRSTMN